jgi:DNA-binding PadR family transcriptional regulator
MYRTVAGWWLRRAARSGSLLRRRIAVSAFASPQPNNWRNRFLFPGEKLIALIEGNNTTMANKLQQFPGELEELVLLATLKLYPRAYGVAIQEVIERATRDSVNVRGLYTTLKRLRDKQWIHDVEPKSDARIPASGPARHYYQVSSLGRQALRHAAQARARQERFRLILSNGTPVMEPAHAPITKRKEIVYG